MAIIFIYEICYTQLLGLGFGKVTCEGRKTGSVIALVALIADSRVPCSKHFPYL